MAAPYQGFLRTKAKEIIRTSVCTHSRTILKTLNSDRIWARDFASNSKEDSKESNLSHSKTQRHQETDTKDPPKKKSVWLEPIPEEFRSDHLPNAARNTEREYFQHALDPNRKSPFEGRFYSKKHGVSRDLVAWLTWNININDNLEIALVSNRYQFNQRKIEQRLDPERIKVMGHDLEAAHFITAHGGAVKFVGRDYWYMKDSQNRSSIPTTFVPSLFVEAIDTSNTSLTYVGFDHLENLTRLRYLKINNCPHIDDWCLSRLQRQKHTLEFLDISNCPNITDNGLSALSCLQKLKGLRLSNLENVKHLGLLTLLLEEKIPELSILGVTDEELKPPSWAHRGERRLVRALLGYVDEEKEGDNIGKVDELPDINSPDYNSVSKRLVRRVE